MCLRLQQQAPRDAYSTTCSSDRPRLTVGVELLEDIDEFSLGNRAILVRVECVEHLVQEVHVHSSHDDDCVC